MANKLKSALPRDIEEQESEPVSKPNAAPKKSEKANTVKSNNSAKAISLLNFFTDGRAIKMAGLLLLLMSLYFFVAFCSFLLTWQDDQSVVANASLNILFDAENNKVENWLGIIGAMISQIFIHRWFGILLMLT